MMLTLKRTAAVILTLFALDLVINQLFPEHRHRMAGDTVIASAYAQGSGQIQRTLCFPRLLTNGGTATKPDDSEYTGIAVANLDSTAATLTFTAYDKAGSVISGANITNPVIRTLGPGEQLPIVDFQIFGSGWEGKKPIGWMKLESTVSKIYAFFLMFNGELSVLDGADVSAALATSHILPEVMDPAQGFTQISVINPNQKSSYTSVYLYKSDGTSRASSTGLTLPANGALVSTLAELFPGVTPAPTDYVSIYSSPPGASFELLGAKGQSVHGLNGQDVSLGATTLYSPQYVVGGGVYRSMLSLVNLDYKDGTLTLDFISDAGISISKKTVSIKSREKVYISDQNFFVAAGSLTQGYVKITSDGPKLTGDVVFTDSTGKSFAAALPLVNTLQTSVIFSQLASNSTYFTGAAILNPNDSAARVTIDVYDDKGVLIDSATEDFLPGERKSRLLTQVFPNLIGQERSKGYFKIQADKALASFALFGTNNYSVLSAVPPQVLLLDGNYDGRWKGTWVNPSDSDELNIVFSGNRITGFNMDLVMNASGRICISSGPMVYMGAGESFPITNGTFSFPISMDGGTLTTEITGTIASLSKITGTIGVITLKSFRCGSFSYTGTIAAATYTVGR